MICKNCQSENPDDAVFCKQCGKPMNEKTVCSACGKELPDDAVFCPYCGTPLRREKAAAAQTAEVETKALTQRKISEAACGAFAIISVFVVLLCTFLLGFAANGDLSDSGSISTISASENIYYFFGGIYEDLNDLTSLMPNIYGLTTVSLYMPAVFGTIISAGMIVSVLVLSVLTAVRYGLKTAGKGSKDYTVLAIATVLTFVLGSLLLYADNAAFVSAKSSVISDSAYRSSEASVTLNDAGIAGIVCGLVCLGIFLAFTIARKGKELVNGRTVLKFCFTASALVLLGIIFGFAGKAGIVTKSESNYGTVITGCNLFSWGRSLAIFANYSSGAGYGEPDGEYILAFLGQTAQFALLVLCALAVISRLVHLTADNKKSGLALAVAVAAAAVLYLVLDVLTIKFSNEFLFGEEGSPNTYNYAYPVVTLVFAVLNLAASVAYKALNKRKKTA